MEEPVRLPPTLPPKQAKRVWPRWAKSTAFVVALALVGVVGSSVVNHQVTHRLATTPIGPTTTPPPTVVETTTAVPVPMRPPRTSRQPVVTTTTEVPTTTTEPEPPATPSELITALDALKVQEEHPQGFRGGTFGYWRDDDHDGCNTRDEVLIAESLEPVKTANVCRILEGRWYSAYDDQTFTQPRDMSIDHVVTIAEAWRSGAWQWTDKQRNDYLNDLDHADALIAVSDQSKDEKADFDPRRWLPANTEYRCDYLTIWVHIKTLYKLSVDPAEREAIAAAALHC